jgi:hypothetical protein
MERFAGFLAFALLILFSGCASSGSLQKGVYRTKLGTAPSGEIVTVIRDVVRDRYGYRFDREVINQEQIRFTTEWKEHLRDGEEKQRGILASRSRLEVRARPSRRSGGGVENYRIYFEAVYQTRSDSSGGDWTSSPMPEGRTEYFKDLSRLISNQMESGLRSL